MVCDGVATPWDVDGDISDMKGPLSGDGVATSWDVDGDISDMKGPLSGDEVATSWGIDGDMNDIATNNADKYVLVKPDHE